MGEFKNVDTDDKEFIKEKMLDIIVQVKNKLQETKEMEALKQMSTSELAESFVNILKNVFKGDENIKKSLTEKMANTFSKDTLYFFVYLAKKYYAEREWQAMYKSLLLDFKESMKGGAK